MVRYRENDVRSRRLRQVMEAADENTKAGAIDTALAHYISDLRNKEKVAEDLDADVLEELSTPYISLERKTSVGRGD